MTIQYNNNVDGAEIAKFAEISARWWDVNSEFKPLHDINPLRLDYIDQYARIAGRQVLDVGCGGGILSEGLFKKGAAVLGIDAGEMPLSVAKLHQLESGVDIQYQQTTAEQLAESKASNFDIVTCMEVLEHVPRPELVVEACSKLVKQGGYVFFSTIHRNLKSYLFAIIGAEYILKLLPQGTHDYDRFIRPSELARWSRNNGLVELDVTGMSYNPLTQQYSLHDDVSVNYLVCCQRK